MIVCPNCGMNLKFNIPLQELYCDSCNSHFNPYVFDNKTTDGIETVKEDGEYETTVFTCPQCGGEIESTDTDITGFCSFCGAATIFYTRLAKEKKPDFILPFTQTKEQCKMAFQARAKKNLYAPKEYRDPQYIDGFRGIYMPYWSYDVDQRGPSILRGEKTHRSGDYIIHEHYDLKGDLDTFYHGIAYDASSSFSDDISEAIAPYDVKKKQPFTAGFLSGFYADTADVPSEIYTKDALNFSNANTLSELKKVPEFAGYSIKDEPTRTHFGTTLARVEKTLFPVWFLSFRNGDRVAYAAVNGQTGKVCADLPISMGRFYAGAGILIVLAFLFLNMVLTLTPRASTVLALIISIATLILYLVEADALKKRDNKTDDKGYQLKVNGINPNVKTKKKKKPEEKGKSKPFPVVSLLICAAVCGLGIWLNAANDMFYYGLDIIVAVFILITLIMLIKDYNLLATRPLPQFQKKGGDDNA